MSLVTDTALLFPGQGSQTPEMRDLVAQRCPELLERCIALVGEDPFARVDESTRFQQPAIFCASIAGWRGLPEDIEPGAAAGHSLGELAALAAAGVLGVDDALELVVLRGRLMAEADDRGSMLALVGADEDEAAKVAEAASLTVANDNAPGQIVLAGDRESFDRAEEVAGELGKRTIRLPVAGAFHSPSMEPAVAPFRAALDDVEVGDPRFTVFSCASAAPFADVRDELGERPDPPGPLARDVHRHPRRRRDPLRRGRSRQGAGAPRQADRPRHEGRDAERGARPCLRPRPRRRP